MLAPTFTSRLDTYIVLTWSALSGNDTGRSPILNYTLIYDNGTGIVNI